ncbi:energy transducer TonB [Cyclobacterium xiamenense]|uniref:energy transducer TonB n=1 Tax=Cyclobacterium xiamenense TaxID=1297121 RepID=UPI0012B7CD07|nr:energy transducer TonB [Cyclobacterium xiamenense]
MATNRRYPSTAFAMGESGTLGVVVTSTKDGQIIHPFIPNEGDKDLDEEALRVTRLLPDEWVPLKLMA